jgi:hypothetical protein
MREALFDFGILLDFPYKANLATSGPGQVACHRRHPAFSLACIDSCGRTLMDRLLNPCRYIQYVILNERVSSFEFRVAFFSGSRKIDKVGTPQDILCHNMPQA